MAGASVSAIEMKSYAESGLVDVATVDALLAFGEPMITEEFRDTPGGRGSHRTYRAWIRLRSGGRTFGPVRHLTPQFAAEILLRKLEGRR